MPSARQWREAAAELRRMADKYDGNAAEIETYTAHKITLCAVVSASGPNGEPLACAFLEGHDGDHSWSTLPTFTAGVTATPKEAGE